MAAIISPRDFEEMVRMKAWVEETERESQETGCGVAPYPYERLAIIYRRSRMPEQEVEILRRFAVQPHAVGVKPPRLLERLRKLT